MNEIVNVSRRDFLKTGAVAGAGLTLGLVVPSQWIAPSQWISVARAQAATDVPVTAYLRISPDSIVTVIVGNSEMGQGVSTGVPMLIAEELGADWSKIRWEHAPNDATNFGRPNNGPQITGGSGTQRQMMPVYRKGAATAREMLIMAAAKEWGVEPTACRTDQGYVVHAGGKRASFGELAAKAGAMPVPANVKLKDRKDWTIIGTSPARLDIPDKVNGKAVFGMDVQLPGLLVASVARPPVFGAGVASFDAAETMKIKGVQRVVEISSGVAIVADGYWNARRGREALKIKWKSTSNDGVDSTQLRARWSEAADKPGLKATDQGDFDAAIEKAARRVEATYETPYLAHQTMEPQNMTAWVHDGLCEVWGGVQSQTVAENAAAEAAGLSRTKVRIHTTLLGCGFGRRSEASDVAEAVELAKLVGAPVKIIWTREEDMQHDFYRPMTVNKMSAGFDGKGNLVALRARLAGQSIFARRAPQNLRNGIDGQSVECMENPPYEIANLRVEQCTTQAHVPVGFWRSVGASQNVFVLESFIDELAAAAGKDPLEFRRELIGAKHARHKRVLEMAAEKAGWGTPLPAGRARGIAVAESFQGFVAEVAEVSVAADGKLKIHRVVAACDFGTVVHPAIVKSQVESSIVTGMDQLLYNRITIKNGAVEQGNFHDNPLPRITDMPAVEVHLVETTEPPGGVGEPAVPPLAPAVCNAIFALTKKRIRTLPVDIDMLRT